MVVDESVLIRDSTVGTYVCTARATVTEKLVCLCGAGVSEKLILCKESDNLNCCGTCLRNRLGNILRSLNNTGKEDTCGGGLNGTKLCVSLGKEVVGIDTCGEHGSDLSYVLVGLDSGSKNYHISFLEDLLVVKKVGALNEELAVRLRNNLTNLTLDIIYTVLLNCTAVELVKVLTGGTNVDVEYGYVYIRILIADEHCVLCGVHAADLGAVGLTSVVRATAADTLNEYDLLGSLTVGKSLEMTVCGTCGVHNSLELEGGDNVGALVVCVLVVLIKIDGVETGCNNDCAVLFGYDLILLSIINCARCTDLLAETALAGLELDASLGVDYGYVRDSLCEGSVDSGSGAETTVKLAGSLLGGTLLLTCAATGTLVSIDKSCLFADIDCKVAHKAADLLNFAVCINCDVLVSGCLNHFRSKDTSRAVECGEGLVKLRHSSADGGGLLNDVYLIARVCDIDCGLNTCDTAADNECTLGYAALTGGKGSVEVDLCNCGTCKNNCLFGSLFNVLVDPRAMLTDVCDLNHIGVDSRTLCSLSEGSLVHTGRARANNDTGQLLLSYCDGDLFLTCLGAHVLIIFSMHNAGLGGDHLDNLFNVYRCGDVTTAVTDKYTNSLHSAHLLYLLYALTRSC